jgi:long-chain acyl-CoA synthetase
VIMRSMQHNAVTGFAGVPSTFAVLLDRVDLAQLNWPALRYVTQAGGGMPPARIEEWRRRVPNVDFYVMYGATEAAARLTYLEPGALERKLGSIGQPIPNVDIRVIKEDGTPAKPGEVGELLAQGANISCGYWNDPQETNAKFGPMGYRTGDLGYVDDDGYLFLVGRKDDMIKTGAHRIGPKEIEDVLCQHPHVRETAVIGAPHVILGEAPVAFVVLTPGAGQDSDVLRAFCHQQLAPFKVPVRFYFVEQLPRLAGSGKLDRVTLRATLAQSVGSGLG